MVGVGQNCLICGAELVYGEAMEMQTCALCGKEEMGNAACAAGHYVCNACHRQGGVAFMLELCAQSASANAIEILQAAMDDKSVYPNGPEHHTLVGASIITAFCNAGGQVAGGAMTKEQALQELASRSMQVPGGACGYWGCCGAAISAGQALSVIYGSSPLAGETWGQCQRLTSTVLGHLADWGGPRCCKRTSVTAVLDSIDYLNAHFEVSMPRPEKVVCRYCAGNRQCIGNACPYFPAH